MRVCWRVWMVLGFSMLISQDNMGLLIGVDWVRVLEMWNSMLSLSPKTSVVEEGKWLEPLDYKPWREHQLQWNWLQYKKDHLCEEMEANRNQASRTKQYSCTNHWFFNLALKKLLETATDQWILNCQWQGCQFWKSTPAPNALLSTKAVALMWLQSRVYSLAVWTRDTQSCLWQVGNIWKTAGISFHDGQISCCAKIYVGCPWVCTLVNPWLPFLRAHKSPALSLVGVYK